ncbi:MAG: phosphatidate cytidylyltransferase [Synechococcaceae cyanobacterium SM2_3_2]|nr:phosphatidate cytidylyltransferase [Synechococcaceae cyanobacterium SM2_3_2]
MALLLQVLCCGLWLGLVFGLAELLRRRQVDSEIVRKVVHIGVGNIILLAWFLQVPRWTGILFSVIFAGLVLVSFRVKILESLNGVNRHSFGTFFYAVSIGILLGVFWFPARGLQPFAVIGILVMTWGDALAALVGQAWGKHPYQIGSLRKSWEGSLTMCGVSTVVVLAVLTGVWGWSVALVPAALLVGVVAAGLEMISWSGLDNLTVPLGCGVLSYWLFKAVL